MVKIEFLGGDALRIYKVYDFEMAKHVWVQLKGIEKPAYVEGDKVEVEQGTSATIVKKGNQQVAEFVYGSVLGWWISDDGQP